VQTKFIEATNGPQNWGKFMLARFDGDEWFRPSAVGPAKWSLLQQIGKDTKSLLVLDLQTGEGAILRPGGSAHADLEKHRIWVCPLFEPFLAWLYEQDLTDLDVLPAHVDLPDAAFAIAGYRRPGPQPAP
jgi:hypothetical protein